MSVHGQPWRPGDTCCAPGELRLVIQNIQSYEQDRVPKSSDN